jgi:hypothetical protein
MQNLAFFDFTIPSPFEKNVRFSKQNNPEITSRPLISNLVLPIFGLFFINVINPRSPHTIRVLSVISSSFSDGVDAQSTPAIQDPIEL